MKANASRGTIFTLTEHGLSPGLLRLVLASAVVIHHVSNLSLGAWAVNVFFILSGYWVTVMFNKKYSQERSPALSFYAGRVLRLMPVFVLCQLMMIFVLRHWHYASVTAVTTMWLMRAVLLVGSAHQKVLLVPAWSLDVECQFYLIVPVMIWLLSRLSVRAAGVSAVIAAAVLLPFCFMRVADIENPWLITFFSFFLIGVAQAYLVWKPTLRVALWSAGTFLAAVSLCIALPVSRGLMLGGSHPQNPGLFAHNNSFCVVLTLVAVPFVLYSLSIRSSKRDKHLGNMAYPLYLFHWVLIIPLFEGVFGTSKLKSKLLYLLCVGIGTLLIEYGVDQPCEKARESIMQRMFGKPAREGVVS